MDSPHRNADSGPPGIPAGQEHSKVFINGLATYGLMLAVLVFAFAPVLATNYFFYDDYVQFTNHGVPFSVLLPPYLTTYRPGFAVWLWLATNSDNTILDSVWVRFVGVVGLALLCLVFYAWARRRGFERFHAFCLGIFVCTTPAFQSTVGYMSAVVSVYCCLFSAMSAMVVLETWTSGKTSRLRRGLAIVGGALLLMVAVGTYQPPAMFCWVMVAVALCAPRLPDWRRFRTALLVFLGTFGLAMGGTFVFSKILMVWLHMLPLGRTSLLSNVSEIIAKVKWFALVVVPNSFIRVLYGWSENLLLPTPTALRVIGILLLLGLLVPFLRRSEQSSWWPRIQQMACVPVLLFLAYFPFMPIKENSLLTVYLTVLQPFLAVVSICGMGHVWMMATRKLAFLGRLKVGTAGIALVALISVWTCNRNMLQVYVLPNAVEYRYVKTQLTRANLKNVSHIHIEGHLHFSNVLTYSERLVGVVLNELRPGRTIRITSSSPEVPWYIHEEIIVRNPELLRPAYAMTPQGYYALRADLTAEELGRLREYFGSMSSLYRSQGALVIDVTGLEDITGRWKGML